MTDSTLHASDAAAATDRPVIKMAPFGLGKVPLGKWDDYRDCVSNLLRMIEQGDVANTPANIETLNRVRSMFKAVASMSWHYWFAVSRMFGHPSADFSRNAASRVSYFRSAIKSGKPEYVEKFLGSLREPSFVECLKHYVSVANGEKKPIADRCWVYMAWSSSEDDIVALGAAGGSIEDVLGRLDRENRDKARYGILGAWRVDDAVSAHHAIRDAFDDFALGDGFYRLDVEEAKERIGWMLRDAGNAMHSAWHEAGAPCRPGAVEGSVAADYSEAA